MQAFSYFQIEELCEICCPKEVILKKNRVSFRQQTYTKKKVPKIRIRKRVTPQFEFYFVNMVKKRENEK
jgi:hypothetical protein